MRKISIKKMISIIGICLLTAHTSYADKDVTSAAPYFYVHSEKDVESFPLKKTSADVKIISSIASVTIEQTYVNEGKTAIEAIYVFPGSTKAAINALQMKIGERTIVAKIAEKEQARKDYDQAKIDGKSATLLEQHRPNVFQMNVANIMPGDVIQVKLVYSELVESENGEYSFVFPTVVGPRYQSLDNPSKEGEAWNQNPYLKKDKEVPYEFDLKTTLQSAIPIASAICKSHDAAIQFNGKNSASIHFNKTNEGNRDFIFKYRLQGDKIESGLMVFPNEKESFFMALMEPPALPLKTEITPREFVFILDISGSMNGFPIEISKKLITEMIDLLTDNDYFNIMTFAGTSMVFSEQSSKATSDNKRKAKTFVESRQSGGGTELLPALKKVFAIPKQEGLSRSIVIATDGYITVERECFELIGKQGSESNIHTFGIGTSVNRYLLEGMGKIGKGYHCVITDGKDAAKEASKFRNFIEMPLLTDIKVKINSNSQVDLEPSTITDLLAGRPIIICGKINGLPSGSLTIEGMNGKNKFSQTFNYSNAMVSKDFEALKYLWARKRISRLDDLTYMGIKEENKPEVLALGLKYNLLTAYTSFLAVDSEVRNESREYATVHQALPLPHRVEESAVMGRSVSSSKIMSMEIIQYSEPEIYKYSPKTVYRSGEEIHPIKNKGRKNMTNEIQEDDAKANPHLEEKSKTLYFKMFAPKTINFGSYPSFKNGQQDYENYLKTNLVYPQEAKINKLQGKVFVLVDLDEQGNVVQVKLNKGVSKDLDAEALRVIKSMPAWKPAQWKDKNVKSRIELIVEFKL